MAKRTGRNELLAGTFIVAAVGLTVVVLLLLADWRALTERKKQVRVVFAGQSVKGLAAGASVEYNGVPVGKVREVRLAYAHPRNIEAILEVPRDLPLYANASLSIGTTALGGSPWIQIDDTGSKDGYRVPDCGPMDLPTPCYLPLSAVTSTQPDSRAQRVEVPLADEDGCPIYGSESPNALIADMSKTLGLGPEQRTQLQVMIASLSAATGTLNEMLAQVQTTMLPKVDDSLTNIRSMSDSGQRLVAAMQAKVPPTLDKVDDSVGHIHKLLDEQSPVIADAIKRINSMAGTLDAGTKQQLANVETAMKQLNDALAKAKEATENIRQFTGTARDVLNTNRDGLNDTFANLREGSDHLAAGLSEIRREPWRLLHTPAAGEENASNVMAAARAYAEGAGSLRDASTRLSALVMARGAEMKADDPHYRELLAGLRTSQEKFDKAERALYAILKVK